MKTFILLMLFTTSFAFAGEKGNGITGIDERFEERATEICPEVVNTLVDDLNEDIIVRLGEEKVAYKREDVLRYCCSNITVGPACFARAEI